jgi:hypothetical protein
MGKDSKKRKHHHHHDSDDERKDKKKSSRSDDTAKSSNSSAKIEEVAKILGYSNDINPFGDSNLFVPFQWKKKEEKSSKSSRHHSKANDEDNRLELLDEIEKARKRRQDRENELAEMERLRFEEQRLREAASFGDWQSKEEDFHREQIRVRSVLRILDGREKNIDLIAKNIILTESVLEGNTREENDAKEKLQLIDVEMRSPIEIIDSADSQGLEELREDCHSYIELERSKSTPHVKYFELLQTIIGEEIKARKSSDRVVHRSVMKEVHQLMEDKSSGELDRLQADIERSIRENKYGDRDYWEAMAKEVRLQRAKTYILEIHERLLKQHIEHLAAVHAARPKVVVQDTDESSPSLDDSARAQMLLKLEQEKGLDEDEGQLLSSEEVQLPPQHYPWADTIQPRKPRYFNRVRTGYDWNKYNSTHYDRDNPPPRMIQGYKFSIFYPDLIDTTVTPRYFLEPTDNDDIVIIRFHAGPPYEDIAFRIVNKQWDTHKQSGFKCIFDRGVLQLHFNFRRHWYRR